MLTLTENAVAVDSVNETYIKIRGRRMYPGLCTNVAASQQEVTGSMRIRNG